MERVKGNYHFIEIRTIKENENPVEKYIGTYRVVMECHLEVGSQGKLM